MSRSIPLCVALAALLHTATAQSVVPPPTDVVLRSTGEYTWIQGRLNVSWTPPATVDALSAYEVRIAPLDHTNSFTDAATALADFRTDLAGVANTGVAVAGGELRVTVNGNAVHTPTTGRGSAPITFRRVPEGAAIEVTIAACTPSADVPNVACGLVLFHGGTNAPLFTWQLVASSRYVRNLQQHARAPPPLR